MRLLSFFAAAFLTTGAQAGPAAQQPNDCQAPQSAKSESCRQAPADFESQRDRVADKQSRMIECNRQAREKEMRGAVRQGFVRQCLKGDTAAAGGRR